MSVLRLHRVATRARTNLGRSPSGMTLVEVMLAVAILATIVALTWGTVSSSFRFRTATLDKFDRYRGVQQALDRMAREISMAFVTNIGQVATNDRGEITYRTIFEGRDDELTFTSLAHVRTRPGERTSEQCEISYRVEAMRGIDGQIRDNLVRREDAPIDADPDEGGVKYTLLEGVTRIRFEYWDSTREIAGEAWVRQWDAINDHAGMLPSRVRIEVEVEHPLLERETLTFATQTQIHLVDPLIIVPADIADEIREAAEALSGEVCDDGVDNNGNGDVDCDDDACLEDPDCEDDLVDEP